MRPISDEEREIRKDAAKIALAWVVNEVREKAAWIDCQGPCDATASIWCDVADFIEKLGCQ